MIYREINTSKLDKSTNLTEKEYYLILLHETHKKDHSFLFGNGSSVIYYRYQEGLKKVSISEFIPPNGYLILDKGEILVHASILEDHWVEMKHYYKDKMVLPVNNKVLNLIKINIL